jgi:PBP1b-binding outer membrane lipoprotein LpoB
MRTLYSLLLAALLLAGCVNVHVHFPSAPSTPAEEQQKKP